MSQKPLLFYCGNGGRSPYDRIATEENWKLGIRSDNPTPTRKVDFVDNNYKNYNHQIHLDMVRHCRPHLATARDIQEKSDLHQILTEAEEISQYCDFVILIPKVIVKLPQLNFPWLFGYSVPTSYGECTLPLSFFDGNLVHLLGGSPSSQAKLAEKMQVYSIDGNYSMKIAKFGKSCWPGCSGIKIKEGCYESFRYSLSQQRTYWLS